MSFSMHATKTIGSLLFASVLAIAAGCDDPTPATPRVVLRTTFGPGSEANVNDSKKCGFATEPWIDIGDVTDRSKVKYVLDGDTAGNPPGRVGIVCTVKPDGDGFRFDGNVTIDTMGSLTIGGHFAKTGTQSNISAQWQRSDTGTFSDDACTVTFDKDPVMGVFPGRIWGFLDCPHATFSEQSRTCRGTAEFRFENCVQN
jgi:hypothetical protein